MTKPLSEMSYEERKSAPGLTTYEMLYGKTEHEIKKELLAVMKREGVHRLEATYSGGHDEGGVQELSCWDAAGDIVVGLADDALWDACNEVLSTKFFSWALGCSVYGTLHVDLAEKRAWTVGQYEDWVDDEDGLEWKL